MKVNVLGKPYTIIETSETLSANSIMGATNVQRQTIVLLTPKEIGPEQRDDTLLHEVIHVVEKELKLDLSEEQVARLAVGLYSAGCRVKVEK